MSASRPVPPTVAADASSAEGRLLAEQIAAHWREQRMDGAFLARNPATGGWLGFGLDRPMPLASVVKVPIALAALALIDAGDLDPDEPHRVDPPDTLEGPTGLAVFTRPAVLAVPDLIYLMLAFSDNRAADVVIDLVGLDRLQMIIDGWGLHALRIRHHLSDLFGTAVGQSRDDFSLALELAVAAGSPDGRHKISTLDVRSANTGTARALAELLERIWTDDIADATSTARLRELMGRQPASHRLAAELRSDNVMISAKTGSYLQLRHEVGVVETVTGETVVVVALTGSTVPAFVQPAADAAIGAAARDAFDLLRG